jgi:uncharacterized cupin superfamily protein
VAHVIVTSPSRAVVIIIILTRHENQKQQVMSLAFVRCFRKDAFPRKIDKESLRHQKATSLPPLIVTPTLPTAATDIDAKTSSVYPKQFQSFVNGRSKRALGNYFGLENFGVNHTTLSPGASSALLHHHSKQDELVYILQGTATLHLGNEKIQMKSGSCIGFPAGHGVGHCIVNQSDSDVVYLEIGDRTRGDKVDYPGMDLKAFEKDGKWYFTHKDGTLYKE